MSDGFVQQSQSFGPVRDATSQIAFLSRAGEANFLRIATRVQRDP
jgi:hypothetical protein